MIFQNSIINLNTFDTYGNNLRKRITIINAIKQDFLQNKQLDYTSNDENGENLKLYFLIRNNSQKNSSQCININNNF